MEATLPAAPAVSKPAGRSAWVVSPAFDLTFFHGSAIAVLTVLVMSQVLHLSQFAVMAFVGVTSNGPHLASTWTRVYMDRRELRQRPFMFIGVPLLIAAVLTGIVGWSGKIVPLLPAGNLASDLAPIAGDPGRVFNSIVLYWASWHFAAQCYGILRIYHHKSREARRPAHRAEAAFIFAAAASGLLWRLHFGPRELFGREALSPPIPLFLVVLSVAAVFASAVLVAVDQVQQARRSEPVAWSRLGFLVAVLVGFWVPFLAIKSGTDAFFAAACWHGFQYLGIVYFYNRNKHAGGPQEGAKLIGWVSQPGRWWAYAALVLALAGLALGSVKALAFVLNRREFEIGLVVWTGLTLSHYWIDGLIWKMRRPEVRQRLNIEPAAA